MNKATELLDGSKTYIVALAMVIVGIYNNDTNLILEGFALAGLRSGIAKIGK